MHDEIRCKLLCDVQVTALQNGNSFNTMFVQNTQVQTISINRTSSLITIDGVFSEGNLTSTGTVACGVSTQFKSCTLHFESPFCWLACG